ncbi:MAG: hypothetical protein MI861_04550 [Pirellulales bacterium]|nr:hypothetical protein [Pirellulales bacterium]
MSVDSPNPYQSPTTVDELVPASSHRRATDKPWSVLQVVLLGLLIPGLPSALIGRSAAGMLKFLTLSLTIPFAFVVFGPLWGEVMFAGTPYTETGFYPFVATCLIVPPLSIAIGLNDRRRTFQSSQSSG